MPYDGAKQRPSSPGVPRDVEEAGSKGMMRAATTADLDLDLGSCLVVRYDVISWRWPRSSDVVIAIVDGLAISSHHTIDRWVVRLTWF